MIKSDFGQKRNEIKKNLFLISFLNLHSHVRNDLDVSKCIFWSNDLNEINFVTQWSVRTFDFKNI